MKDHELANHKVKKYFLHFIYDTMACTSPLTLDSISTLQVRCTSIKIISSTHKASHYLILSMLVETGL